MKQPRLSLEFMLRNAYGEYDEQEFKVSIVGDSFSGELVIYDDHSRLTELCSALSGYPRHPNDEVRFNLGMVNKLDIHLSCADSNGHILMDTTLVGEFFGPPAGKETLSAVLRCDPSSIDDFRSALLRAQPGNLEEVTIFGRRQGQ